MRVLVVGAGSIGMRHLRNLRQLGISELAVVDPSEARRTLATSETGAVAFADIAQGLATKPSVVFVTTPTREHVPVALAAASAGCDLFIEKPLSHTETDLGELLRLAQQHRLVTMVGCNMRFHHGPMTMKRLIDDRVLGAIYSVSLEGASYLPGWRPGQDYRESYSARRELGGGAILDGVHEIDYARWLFGEIDAVFAHGGKLGHLEIDVEDSANVVLVFRAGFSALYHTDYLQRTYARTCKVVGELGTLTWSFGGPVRWYDAATAAWTEFPEPPEHDVNAMYMAEIRHFIDCVTHRRPAMSDVVEAARVTRIALAIRESLERSEKVVV